MAFKMNKENRAERGNQQRFQSPDKKPRNHPIMDCLGEEAERRPVLAVPDESVVLASEGLPERFWHVVRHLEETDGLLKGHWLLTLTQPLSPERLQPRWTADWAREHPEHAQRILKDLLQLVENLTLALASDQDGQYPNAARELATYRMHKQFHKRQRTHQPESSETLETGRPHTADDRSSMP